MRLHVVELLTILLARPSSSRQAIVAQSVWPLEVRALMTYILIAKYKYSGIKYLTHHHYPCSEERGDQDFPVLWECSVGLEERHRGNLESVEALF